MPASIAMPGFVIAISLPSIRIAPEVAGVTPNSVSATLLRPEPTRPATPRISPLRRSNDTPWNLPSRQRSRSRQRDVADRRDLLREHLGDLAANHQLDDLVARNIRGLVLANEPPVAEHRHLVGDLEQLVHLMGDVDDARALILERTDDPEQVLDLAFRQRRGWLIHDQDVGIVGDGLRDLDHLPVGDREVAHFRFRIEGNVETLEQRPLCAVASPHDARSRGCSAARGGSRCSQRRSCNPSS